MFKDSKAFSSFSVDDLQKAKAFYTGILQLEVKELEMGVMELHLAGGTTVLVYPKPNHEAAGFTVLNFPVPNVEEKVAALKNAGVTFERYDLPELKTDADNICRGGGPVIAWFKDPAGNIIAVMNEG